MYEGHLFYIQPSWYANKQLPKVLQIKDIFFILMLCKNTGGSIVQIKDIFFTLML